MSAAFAKHFLDYARSECWRWKRMESPSGWRHHFPERRPSTSSSSIIGTISLTARRTHSEYPRRCIARGGFIPAASNPVNRLIGRLAWKVRRLAAGFSIALFPRPSGGTIFFSREATCFSSGRKNEFASGAPRMVIPCGHSSRWTSYGRSLGPGIRRDCKRRRAVLSPMKCVPFSPASAWAAIFGIRNRIASVNRLALSAFQRFVVKSWAAKSWSRSPTTNRSRPIGANLLR